MAAAVCAPAVAPEGMHNVWAAIFSDKKAAASPAGTSCLLSQKSLDVCTETLCSDSGSDGFLSDEDAHVTLPRAQERAAGSAAAPYGGRRTVVSAQRHGSKELLSVNYHCSGGARSLPPPLPSISRRDGTSIRLRAKRSGGRLVIEAVATPAKHYLHAQRQGGRLRLCFVDCGAKDESLRSQEHDPDELVVEEEEVEVVDRGTVVEVKVSTQPLLPAGAGAPVKVHRSSLVINKFVGGAPIVDGEKGERVTPPPSASLRRVPSTATSTVAALAAAASRTIAPADGECDSNELPWRVSRCSVLRPPIFIWEPYCIATS